jgi:hypothetical protein
LLGQALKNIPEFLILGDFKLEKPAGRLQYEKAQILSFWDNTK